MTPRPPIPYALAVASLLLAVPVAYAEESRPTSTAPPATPDSSASLAGRRAGEGRIRPGRSLSASTVPPSTARTPSAPGSPSTGSTGRPEEKGTVEDLPADPDSLPDTSHVPGTPPPAAARKPKAEALPEPAARPVSVPMLGAGIALIGIGLGFLGIRLRRL